MSLKPDFLESYDPASIAVELRRIAAITGKTTVSRQDIDRYGRLCSQTVSRKFGTLRRANEIAGLLPRRSVQATDEELLRMLADLWRLTAEEYGRSPVAGDVARYGLSVSHALFIQRFGTWRNALIGASAFSMRPEGAPYDSRATFRLPEKKPVRRATISVRKRFLVFKRNRYQCQICKRYGGDLVVDHIVPLFHGGSDRLDNLQTLCKACNEGKNSSLQ